MKKLVKRVFPTAGKLTNNTSLYEYFQKLRAEMSKDIAIVVLVIHNFLTRRGSEKNLLSSAREYVLKNHPNDDILVSKFGFELRKTVKSKPPKITSLEIENLKQEIREKEKAIKEEWNMLKSNKRFKNDKSRMDRLKKTIPGANIEFGVTISINVPNKEMAK